MTISQHDDIMNELAKMQAKAHAEAEKAAREAVDAAETAGSETPGESTHPDTDDVTIGFTDSQAYLEQTWAYQMDEVPRLALAHHGVTPATAARCGIGYDPERRQLIAGTDAHYYGVSFLPTRASVELPGKMVYITSSIWDALAICEAGGLAISGNGTNIDVVCSYLDDRSDGAFAVCCRDDGADDLNNKRILDKLNELGLEPEATRNDICGIYDGPCDALTHDRKAFCEAVQATESAERQLPGDLYGYVSNGLMKSIQAFSENSPTGYRCIDAAAKGGLYSGLYVIGAISSLGKTTFVWQLADQVAAAGHDVMYFSLEQSIFEMTAKSLARIIGRDSDRPELSLESLDIRKGKGGDAVKKAARRYLKTVGHHMSVIQGNFGFSADDIEQQVQTAIDRGHRPIVIIDYLQVLQPPKTEKRNMSVYEATTATVTRLKQMSRDMDLTIIVISSLNRMNYMTPIDFESFRDSGNIEYTADVVWGLQLACIDQFKDWKPSEQNNIGKKRAIVKAAKRANPRKIKFVCIKNRFGISNYECNFDYYPNCDLFREAGTGRWSRSEDVGDVPDFSKEKKKRW